MNEQNAVAIGTQNMSCDGPREYTRDEVREMFIRRVHHLVEEWAVTESVYGPYSIKDRLEGLAFSIFSTLDGSTLEFPAFAVIPDPYPEDKAFHQGEGRNWFPEFKTPCASDIGRGLHEDFVSYKKKA